MSSTLSTFTRRPSFALILGGVVLLLGTRDCQAQLQFSSLGTPRIINFDTTVTNATSQNVNTGVYAGGAPVTGIPANGQLSSGAFTTLAGGAFLGTAAFGSIGQNGAAGAYAFTAPSGQTYGGTGSSLGFVPANGSGTNFATFTLATTNNTGGSVQNFLLNLDLNYFNPATRGVSLVVTYTGAATGTVTFTGATSFAANGTASIFQTSHPTAAITLATAVPNNGTLNFVFTLTAGNGAGNSRDEVSIDNISLTPVPEPGTVAAGIMAAATVGGAIWRRRQQKRPAVTS